MARSWRLLHQSKCVKMDDTVITLASYNINGFESNKDFVVDLCNQNEHMILGLQETWLNDEILESETHIDGYVNYRQDRGGDRKGGGTATYIYVPP